MTNNSEKFIRFNIIVALLFSIANLLIVVIDEEEIPIKFISNWYLVVTYFLIVILTKVYFFRFKSLRVSRFYVKFFIISLSILLFSAIYSHMPSLKQIDKQANNTLTYELKKQYEKAEEFIYSNDYLGLKREFVYADKKIGHMNFKLGKNSEIEENLSHMEEMGDYISKNLLGEMKFRTLEPNGEVDKNFEKTINQNEYNKRYYDFSDSDYGYLDYEDSDTLNKANSIAFKAEVSSELKRKCFYISYKIFYQKDSKKDSEVSQETCLESSENFLYINKALIHQEVFPIKKIRFYIRPAALSIDQNHINNWDLWNVRLLTDTSGLAKEVHVTCIEGYIESEPENIISIQNGVLRDKPCFVLYKTSDE